MNILVTGAKGFVGRNLVENLRTLADGRNKTRPGLSIGEVYEYDLGNTAEELAAFCAGCDFVFHLAGVNRPADGDFSGNYGALSDVLAALEAAGNACPVMLSSSAQATLEGRFAGSVYGQSKLDAEGMLREYGESHGARVLIYRFPNLYGKWCRPRYNSAVATFCDAFANDREFTVNDPSVELELLYIDDLVEEMLDALEGREHRGADGICYAPVTDRVTLGEIVALLEKFKQHPVDLMTPDFTPGCFEKKLYSMYLSYLPAEKTVFDLKMNVDARGSFTELVHTPASGQVSVNITKPGITKGMHWHNTKTEEFIVVAGEGLIRERNLRDGEVREYRVSGERIQSVIMLPGWTHEITNVGECDLVTIMTCNEVFDPAHPDTFFEKV